MLLLPFALALPLNKKHWGCRRDLEVGEGEQHFLQEVMLVQRPER